MPRETRIICPNLSALLAQAPPQLLCPCCADSCHQGTRHVRAPLLGRPSRNTLPPRGPPERCACGGAPHGRERALHHREGSREGRRLRAPVMLSPARGCPVPVSLPLMLSSVAIYEHYVKTAVLQCLWSCVRHSPAHARPQRVASACACSPTGQAYIVDCGSTHGTYLNKRRLKPHALAPFKVGDMVKLGESSRIYVLQVIRRSVERPPYLVVPYWWIEKPRVRPTGRCTPAHMKAYRRPCAACMFRIAFPSHVALDPLSLALMSGCQGPLAHPLSGPPSCHEAP